MSQDRAPIDEELDDLERRHRAEQQADIEANAAGRDAKRREALGLDPAVPTPATMQ